jgi:hypothetical protein
MNLAGVEKASTPKSVYLGINLFMLTEQKVHED